MDERSARTAVPDREDSEPPLVFIGGHARSGTTFFCSLFEGHPSVLVAPKETQFFANWSKFSHERDVRQRFLRLVGHAWDGRKKVRVDRVERGANWRPLTYYRLIEEAHPLCERDLLTFVESQDPVGMFRELIRLLERTIRHGDRAPRVVVEKSPGNEFYFEWLRGRFPNCKMLYIVRHPAHSLHSILKKRRKHGRELTDADVLGTILSWRMSVAAAEICARCLPDAVQHLRFEDLIRDLPGTMARMCAFLDIPYDRSLERASHLGQPWRPSTHEEERRGPQDGRPNPAMLEKNLQDILTSRQLDLIDRFTRSEREVLGYPSARETMSAADRQLPEAQGAARGPLLSRLKARLLLSAPPSLTARLVAGRNVARLRC